MRAVAAIAALVLAYFLFFYQLDGTGLLGPDEPRYAWIGREMARSGDWITPRLWGEPWFEKPVLLYWMIGAGFRLGLGEDLAPRVPVALLSVAFLAFFYQRLVHLFDRQTAFTATAILATSAGWLAFSHVAVTDLPLAVAFSIAVVLALPWLRGEGTASLPFAAAALGIAVLAKGLVPLVLALPLLWSGRKRWRDLLRARVWGVFLLTAVPWYVLCYLWNGWPFIQQFFLLHHFDRFTNDILKHEQPPWFFFPVMLAGLLPWTPLLPLLSSRKVAADARLHPLLAVVAFGFLFFSVSTNKLPGYLLPLFPALAICLAKALASRPKAPALLAACALTLVVLPVAAGVLPQALARGLSRSAPPDFQWWWLSPAAAAPVVWILEHAGRRVQSVTLLVVGVATGVAFLKSHMFPVLDRSVSARHAWTRLAPCGDRLCTENIHRQYQYGLRYYSGELIPTCPAQGKNVAIGEPLSNVECEP